MDNHGAFINKKKLFLINDVHTGEPTVNFLFQLVANIARVCPKTSKVLDS